MTPPELTYNLGSREEERDRYTFNQGYPTSIALTIQFEDEKTKADNCEKINAATWMDLLGGKVPEELRDFDDPKWDKIAAIKAVIPPGWEACVSPAGRTYYIDHNTRTTSWVLPESV
jgi:hypothetical protein